MSSTKEMIKEQISTLPAREAVHKVIEKRGGIIKSDQLEQPRNRAQIYNIAKEAKKEKSLSIGMDDPVLWNF